MTMLISNTSVIVPEKSTTVAVETNDDATVPTNIDHQAIYLCIVAAVGIIANILVIIKTVFPTRRRQGHAILKMAAMKYYVLSLCASNLGTLTISLGFTMLPFYVSFLITDFSCRYILPVRELFLAVSIFSIMLIAIGCCLLHSDETRSSIPVSSKLSVAILWIICYLVFAFPFSFAYKVVHEDGAYVCDSMWSSAIFRRIYILFLITFNVILPGVTVFACYVKIVRNLEKVRTYPDPQAATLNGSLTYLVAKNKKIVKVSLMMVTTYAITYFPYAFLTLAVEFGDFSDDSGFAEQFDLLCAISICLLFSSAAIFPLILLFSRHPFKIRTFGRLRLSTLRSGTYNLT